MLNGKKILIVDDDMSSRELLSKILSKLNAECILVDNAKETIELLQNGNYDLVLLDIKMPILNGFQAFLKIRELNINTPVIAQTAYAFAEDKRKLIETGFNGYISKPIKKSELLNEITKVLQIEE